MEILRCYEDGLERGTQHVDWSKVSSERVAEMIVPYAECRDSTSSAVEKLAILKLNGGLGTTMGCTGPKSVIEVREGKTFLDLIVDQVCELKQSTGHSVPLVLMNSFNTHEETGLVVQRYQGLIDILSFEQSQHPRFSPVDHMPVMSEVSKETLETKNLWYPPGHGDVFEALVNSGTLAKLEQRGVEYVFISNVDNLGATVDFRILNKMIESGSEFVMELTAKTEADVKERRKF
jgi:UTP--glucose-1-phosphate uridylyltransferase